MSALALSCTDCLAAEATVTGDGVSLCAACFNRQTDDYLLDLVGRGELDVLPDGSFRPTALLRARLRAEGSA